MKFSRLNLILLGIIVIFLLIAAGVYFTQTANLSKAAIEASKEGRYADQAQELQHLRIIEPWREDLPLLIADAYFLAEDYPQAAEWYTNVEMKTGLSSADDLRYGESLLKSNKTEEAREIFQHLSTDPALNAEDIQKLVGDQRKLGELEGAVKTLQYWDAENRPGNLKMKEQLALIQLVVDPMAALDTLVDLIAATPELREDYGALLGTLEDTGLDETTRWREIGTYLFNRAEWDLAEAAFSKAVQGSPKDADALAMLGQSKLMQGKDGYPDLVQAQNLDPQSRFARYFLAIYWRSRGQAGIARKYLTSLAGEEPKESLWQVELGRTAFASGDMAAALQYFQAATAGDPKKIANWQALAEFSLASGIDIDSVGETAVQQAILLDPSDPASNDLMGWLLLTKGDADNALKFLRQAVAGDPSSARNHLHLAQALRGIGDLADAKVELQAVVSLDPQSSEGLAASRLLKQLFGGN